MRQRVQQIFAQTIERLRTAGALAVDPVPTFSVMPAKSAEHGDYACNAALVLAKPARQKPHAVAELIVAQLDDPERLIAQAAIAGPGFINIRLDERVWRSVIGAVEQQGDRYGWTVADKPRRINVEYVSANPTGPLHVGHGRGAVVGDALSRLLRAAGHQVTREYYVNDHGNQVDTLARSLHLRYQELQGRSIQFPADAYPAEYVREIARALVEELGPRYLDAPESEWLDLFRQRGIEANLAAIRRDLAELGAEFDLWSRESELHASGAVARLVDALRERGETYQAEASAAAGDRVRRQDSKAAQHAAAQQGGTFARLSQYGDSDDRIVLRHDGRPVYLTSDLAYHLVKFERGYDTLIDIFGADHFVYTKTLRAGLRALGQDAGRQEFVLTQIVRLMRGGQEVRLSKRAGNIELLSDLITAVGPAAARFFFLLRAPTAQFDFDLDVAAQRSLDNPVFYAQYGHARICAVFRRAQQSGVTYRGFDAAAMERLTLPEELSMLRGMAAFGAAVVEAAENREPHRLVYYVDGLIRDFHAYYTRYKKSHRILTDDEVTTQARLGLVNALRQVVHNALELLGVEAPEHMEPLPHEEETA
ncbi:MAG: arginine--tRNA ligase [Deltaproteobacteria bacterium]|nr:arginine--tRNA ligase [Deltaproteobacteria bacterium]